ncbi:fascin-3 [Paroedura picta]|uniref:fascin-3 n=1 Tax=Paroedura picta TaxID=143630 RepID=UPI00405674AA
MPSRAEEPIIESGGEGQRGSRSPHAPSLNVRSTGRAAACAFRGEGPLCAQGTGGGGGGGGGERGSRGGMQVGLIDWTGGYLTAEGYGGALVTALGSALGRRQTWELKASREAAGPTVVELRGPGGRALGAGPDGAVRCAQAAAADGQGQFLLEVHPSGAWSLQQVHSRKYLESDGEDVFCVSRGLTACHMWMPQLAMHAHVVLFNPRLQRYARADPELNRVWVDTRVPYQEECGFILRFRGGVYHLETSRHHFLSRSEKLVEKPSAETAFHLTLRPGCLAFLTDREGRILYPHGSRGLLCLGDSPADKEEWFLIRRCPQWVSLRTAAQRYVTVVCDSDVYAGPKKVTPMSVFHLEVSPDSKTVQLRGINHSYLAQRECKSLVANGNSSEPQTCFQVHWHYGKIFLRALNGCYVGTLPVGLVAARAMHPGPSEEFGLLLANRPFLLLRGQYGYVGSSPSHDVLQCNLLEPDGISLLPCKHSIYHLQTHSKSFWSLTAEKTFKTGGKVALNFCLEIRGNNILAILAPNGYYLRGDREGTLMADSQEVTSETLWEF